MKKDLFLSREEVMKLHEAADERLCGLVAEVMARAEKALETEALTEDKVRLTGFEDKYEAQHERYYMATRPFQEAMPLLCFGFYYTGDNRYFEKARELMLCYAGYERWHGKGFFARGELVTADFCDGMAVGYSVFRDLLTEEERKAIVSGTYEKGILPLMEEWILPGTKIHALDTMGHNWWTACVYDGAMAALVMMEEIPDGERLVQAAAEGLQEWFSYAGNPIDAKPVNFDNGGYYESVHYYGGMALVAPFLFSRMYERATGALPFDDSEILKSAADYFVQTFYPSDKEDYCVPFGDSHGKDMPIAALYIAGTELELPELRWYIRNNTHRKKEGGRDAVYEVMHYDAIYGKPCKKPEKLSVCYDKIGWAVFRDSFDQNASMLAVKCGDTWNHAHADAGSFAFYRDGEPMLFDEGTVGYGETSYVNYYASSLAHNVVLCNGKGQDRRDFFHHARMRGQLYNFTDTEGFRYVAAEATGPMGRYFRKHLRHFLWLDGFILIYDDIVCHEKGELSFLLHAKEENSFRMLSPCTEEERVIYKDEKLEARCSVYIAETDEEGYGKFVSLILTDDSLTPEFTKLKEGYKLTCGDTTVYINLLSDGRIMHQNCINELEGITTDAIMAIKSGKRYGVVNGSILRRDGVSLLDTLARKTGWA